MTQPLFCHIAGSDSTGVPVTRSISERRLLAVTPPFHPRHLRKYTAETHETPIAAVSGRH